MTERADIASPFGLVLLLFYHGLLVLVCVGFGYNFAGMLGLWGDGTALTASDAVIMRLELLALTFWTSALAFASVGMVRRKPVGFLVGMICQAILLVVGLIGMLSLGFAFVASSLGGNDSRAWAPLFLIFALMWLPFVLFSAWAFSYLRRFRRGLLS